MTDPFTALSDQLAARVAAAAPGLVSIHPGTRAQRSGFAWQSGLVVTSEQDLPRGQDIPVLLPGGATAVATLAGRDPGTNVALLRLEIEAPALPDSAPPPNTGAMVLALGSEAGEPTASLGIVHRTGPAWESMAGGTVDRLIRLDLRLSSRAEGGPVLDASGALVGMSTFGPRRRVLVIPASTVRRAIPALADGGAPRAWLGLGLQPVSLPTALHAAAGCETGLMVMSLAPNGPADQAGLLPGDILLDVGGVASPTPRAVARAMAAAIMGQPVPLRLLRAGVPIELSAMPAARPAA